MNAFSGPRIFKRGRRFGVEIKYQDAPKLTASMRTALQDLKLAHLTVVYPGDQAYKLAARVDVIPFVRVVGNPELIAPPGGAVR